MSRVAVVTGAASGIGLGVAQQFVADGYAVGQLDLNGDGASKEAAAIRDEGGSAIGVQCDVATARR
jgi:NAD(P)-dependent dehydrogenase (short-subunit alcohol dehydrogenase family)